MRIVTGFCFAGLFVAAESWLNELSANETRGKLLSVYMLVVFVGMALGQFLLPLGNPRSLDLFILVSALVSLAVVPLLLTQSPAPVVRKPEPLGLRVLYGISPLGVVSVVGSGAAHGALYGLGAVYALQVGFSSTEIAAFMAAPLIGGILSQVPIGRCSDYFDRRKVLVAMALLAVVAATGGVLVESMGTGPLLVSIATLGAATLPLYALSIAHTNDYLSPAQMANASGTLVLAAGLGLSVGPLIVSCSMMWFGASGFFVFFIAIHALMAAFALYRMTRRAARPIDQQGPYVMAIMRGSPVATELALEEMQCDVDDDAEVSRAIGNMKNS